MEIRPGRPRRGESRRRELELIERMSAGESLRDAARHAHVKPERVLTLLGDDAFFAVFAAVRAGELPATAAHVHLDEPADAGVEPEAA